MKKILHIITSLYAGGAESVLYRLCTSDKKNEHIVICLRDAGKYGKLLEEKAIKTYYLKMPKGKVTLKYLKELFRTIKETQPDVIQTWMYHSDLIGGIIGRFAGIRNIFWGVRHSNLSFGTMQAKTIFIARTCAFLSYIIPKKIVYCSKNASVIHQKIGYDKSKTVLIPNGYDMDLFYKKKTEADLIRQEWHISKNKILLGMIARFDPQKDHVNLFKALSLIPNNDLTCVLVGTGMEEKNALIRKLGNNENIILAGERSDIPSVMSALDIHILSSLGEAFPNVLAEAMACETPCISTDVGDAKFIVGKTGWIVPPENPIALSNTISIAIKELKTNPEKWGLRKEEARKRIKQNFSLNKMIERYQRLWNSKPEAS